MVAWQSFAGMLAASSSRGCRRKTSPSEFEGSRGSREPQIPFSAPESCASRRSRRVASGSFDGCPADRTRGLAEFGSLQRRPPAETCGAELADTTDSAAARTKSADRSANSKWERWRWCQRTEGARGAAPLEIPRNQLEASPETVTQTLRQNMARAVRSDPSRTGCGRVGSFGDSCAFSHHRDLGHVAATRAEVRKSLEMQDVPMSHAGVGLLLVAIEETTRDSRWYLAKLMWHLPDPPLEAMSRSVDRNALFNRLRLAKSRWAAASACIRMPASLFVCFLRPLCLSRAHPNREVPTCVHTPAASSNDQRASLATARGRQLPSVARLEWRRGRAGFRIQSRHPTGDDRRAQTSQSRHPTNG